MKERKNRWSIRELRQKLKAGERIPTGDKVKDGPPIYLCNKQDIAMGVHEDCPKVAHGLIYPIKGKVFYGCIGETACDWQGESKRKI